MDLIDWVELELQVEKVVEVECWCLGLKLVVGSVKRREEQLKLLEKRVQMMMAMMNCFVFHQGWI